MPMATSFIKLTNKIFPKIIHPFNLANDGLKSYAEWQFEKGNDTISCYKEITSPKGMFEGKIVLDMGCGAAGKSLYYVSLGANRVVGVDIVPRYKREAMALAAKLGYEGRFSFVCASADDLPFPNGSFDTVIMNDFMEHVSNPEEALREAHRLIKPDGRIFINFPPYGHPTGAHLSDAINLPWAHLIIPERKLVAAYRELVKDLPDAAERISLRITIDDDGRERLGYINKMTLRRFKDMLRRMNIKPLYYNEIPLRPYLKPLARLPLTKEMFVKMAVVVIGKNEKVL